MTELEQLGVTKAHIITFSDNVRQRSQQRLPRLEGTYSPEEVKGEVRFIRVDEKREMADKTVRLGQTRINEQQYTRRGLIPSFGNDADVYDVKRDNLLTGMIDPTSTVTTNTVSARNRWKTQKQIAALIGDVLEQQGSDVSQLKTVSFPVSQTVPADTDTTVSGVPTPFNLGKVLGMAEILDLSDDESVVDEADMPVLLYTRRQLSALLKHAKEVSDSRYTDFKALMEGKIKNFMRFRWVQSELLNKFAQTIGGVVCYPTIAWYKDGIVGGTAYDDVQVTIRSDLNNGVQVANDSCVGFVRLKDELVTVTYSSSVL